jgi:hypothetical protein
MITKFKAVLLAIVISAGLSRAQSPVASFEGEIVYANTYTSKNPKLKEQQLSRMLGSVHNYFIKDGDYKTVTNAMFAQWQLYINKDNKVYNKMASSDTLFWYDGEEYDDQLLNTRINKNAATILGYVCDELVLTCISGVQKYYFNAKLRVDSKLFTRHKFGNYYNYISRANAVPLKMIIEDHDFIIESVAKQIIPKKLDKSLFALPLNAKTAKSVY